MHQQCGQYTDGMGADDDQARRPYRQTRRAEMTAQTRARIREAARALLLDRGYAGTSMRAVAEHAGVGVRTVYDCYPTKTDLLKQVVEAAIVGDAAPVPASGRDWFQAVLDERDPVRRAELLASASTRLHARTAGLFAVARNAAADDEDAARLWRAGKAGHRADCERFARAVVGDDEPALGSLTATLYILIGPETFTLLTGELGFTPQNYEQWLGRQLAITFANVS